MSNQWLQPGALHEMINLAWSDAAMRTISEIAT
jgi:hypothetical protein